MFYSNIYIYLQWKIMVISRYCCCYCCDDYYYYCIAVNSKKKKNLFFYYFSIRGNGQSLRSRLARVYMSKNVCCLANEHNCKLACIFSLKILYTNIYCVLRRTVHCKPVHNKHSLIFQYI